MNAAAPDGAPPRRINDRYLKTAIFFPSVINHLAPPCLGEALRRGALAFRFFHGFSSETMPDNIAIMVSRKT